VDFDRHRQERLQKTRAQVEAFDLGAFVLFAGANIRYVTGSYQENWKYNINIRYVVLPRGGEPVFFRDGRIRPPLRGDRSSLDPAREYPASDHMAMGGRRRASHGQEDG
jgi:Xaa-Pro aminopeptidase